MSYPSSIVQCKSIIWCIWDPGIVTILTTTATTTFGWYCFEMPVWCCCSINEIVWLSLTYGTQLLSGQEKLAVLQEAWASCDGKWNESELFLKMTNRSSHSTYGVRVWMTRGELAKKYGSEEIANVIAENKLNDPVLCKTCVQWHKDAPGNKETLGSM